MPSAQDDGPQTTPASAGDQPSGSASGTQASHGKSGFGSPSKRQVPSIRQAPLRIGFSHVSSPSLHRSAVQESPSPQSRSGPDMQSPVPSQTSSTVQNAPSVHGVPMGSGGWSQASVSSLQTSSVHSTPSRQSRGEPTHSRLELQRSSTVQKRPSSQTSPATVHCALAFALVNHEAKSERTRSEARTSRW